MDSNFEVDLQGKKIALGVTGGIAAYKSVEICRRLVDAGATVIPILTAGALNFVGAQTFKALAKNEVITDLWSNSDPMIHTSLGRSVDLIVVAPATANIIGKAACGIADDVLSTTLIASRSAVVFCAAMHTEMWENPSVVENVETLRRRGHFVLDPESGELAGGDIGVGRLAGIDVIMRTIWELLEQTQDSPKVDISQQNTQVSISSHNQHFRGLRFLVTLGGTREAIDPVRYIGNRSSGRQGLALLNIAARMGGTGFAVSTVDVPKSLGFEVIHVETALEMQEAVFGKLNEIDILIMCAAVSDYRVASSASTKLKRSGESIQLQLVENPDILFEATQYIASHDLSVITVGFAAETDNPLENGKAKLIKKGVDLLVVNNVCEDGAGFDTETNAVWILDRENTISRIDLSSKESVAEEILKRVFKSIYG